MQTSKIKIFTPNFRSTLLDWFRYWRCSRHIPSERQEIQLNLKKVMAFLVELVDHFNPSPGGAHFGLVTFNRKAFTDRNLHSADALKERIRKVPLDLSLQTPTDLAMKVARDNLFSPRGGDRPDNPDIMIMLTDGKPTRQPQDFRVFAAWFYQDLSYNVLNKSRYRKVITKVTEKHSGS